MGAQEKSPTSNNSMQRVKVYQLNDDGKWDDLGTGHVTADYLERSEELALFVVDEEDNETLLLHRISSDDIYKKQEGTIISWRDPAYSTELALSFQENTGCSYIWDQICSVRRSLQFNTLNNETYHTIHSELRELPAVELSTLPLILKTVVQSSITDQCRVTELILHDQDFFRKLMDLFRICEFLENIDGLHVIFKIVRGIILLNCAQIFERIFGDELIMDIIGCLEYDPEVPHVHHRSFLKEHVVFKEAIPIKDPQVLSKIHQTYRVRYLKDVVLPRVLDEATIRSLNSIVHSNNAFVVSMLKDDSTFIKELFARLKAPTTSAESRKKLRVKVYRLNDDGKWDDLGTGHVTADYLERSEELVLFVVDEEDNETLLLHRISSDDIYRNEEDRIISWRDPEYSTELALSFQENTGCSYIWDQICSVQRSLQFNTLNREMMGLDPSDQQLVVKDVIQHDANVFGAEIGDTTCITETSEIENEKSVKDISYEVLEQHFGRPLEDVAEIFNVSRSTFKRRCRDLGIPRWKSHKRKTADNSSSKFRRVGDEPSTRELSCLDMPPIQATSVVAHTSRNVYQVIVKATYKDVIIRFELASSSGIGELQENVTLRLHLEKRNFSIKYQDDEGDWVLIACDNDLKTCLDISRSLKKTTIKMSIDPPITH